jgi:hypothetical protein
MPCLNLTDDELRDAAQATRAAAKRQQREAAIQPDGRIRERFTAVARAYRALAEKFDAARPTRG